MKRVRCSTISACGVGLLWVGVAVVGGCTPSDSASDTPTPASEGGSVAAYAVGEPGGVLVNTVELHATVIALDRDTRKVTLRNAEGEKTTVTVGPEAVNLDQVAVGDQIKLTVTEEIVVQVNQGGGSVDGGAAAVVLAPEGARPGGIVAGTVQITGTITAIDAEQRTATLRFSDGSTRTFPVRDDIDLAGHAVGEQVVFRVTELVALSVEKP